MMTTEKVEAAVEGHEGSKEDKQKGIRQAGR